MVLNAMLVFWNLMALEHFDACIQIDELKPYCKANLMQYFRRNVSDNTHEEIMY